MLITINCLECDTTVDADSTKFGTETPCPKCGESVEIPKAYMGPGVTLGGFEIKDRLGKGGMGEVFLANQINMQRDVALKVLPMRMTTDTEAVQRFLHEAKVAARLEHPNVVTIIDAGEDNGYYYIAMRYVKGKTLEELLKLKGPIQEKDALEYAVKVLMALDFGWRHYKILHRDIKPANIMIDDSGDVRLLDMGLAKDLLEESGITMTGTILGTPYYMSPEQAKSETSLDFHSDMYSVGATLFCLLTGRPPFDADGAVNVMTQHINDVPPDVRSLNNSISDTTARLVDRMLQKKKEDRFASYEELIELISDILDDTPTEEEGIASAPPSAKQGTNTRVLLLAAGLAVAIVGTSAVLVKALRSAPKPFSPPVVKNDDPANIASTARPAPPVVEPVTPPEDDSAGLAKKKLSALESLPTETPEEVIHARERCAQLTKEYDGTPHADGFKAVMGELNSVYGSMCQVEWKRLNNEAWKRFKADQPEAAIALLETYSGPLRDGTASSRESLAEQYRTKIRKRKEDEQAKISAVEDAVRRKQERLRKKFDKNLASTRNTVAKALIVQNFEAALISYSSLQSKKDFVSFKDVIANTFTGLGDLCEMDGIALEAFRGLVGKTVTLKVKGQTLKAEIAGVAEGMVLASEPNPYGSVSHKIPLHDLAPSDRFRLLKGAKPDIREVMKALLYLEMKDLTRARSTLSQCDLPIADVILLEIGLDLQSEWEGLLTAAGLPADETDISRLKRRFDNRMYSDVEKEAVKSKALRFIKYFHTSKKAQQQLTFVRHMAGAKAAFTLPIGFTHTPSSRIKAAGFGKGAQAAIDLQSTFAQQNSLSLQAKNGLGMSFRLVPTGAPWNFLSNPPTKPFYMSTNEVTATEWKKVMGSYRFPLESKMPAQGITMSDAVVFLDKLCVLEGVPKGSYRLPTSSEWIYACTAGTKSRFYFGDKPDDLWRYANYLDKSAPNDYLGRSLGEFKDKKFSDKHSMTSPVGSYPCNPWGFHDMLGNVAEYVADGDINYAIRRGAIKGGSWLFDKRACDVKVDRQLGDRVKKLQRGRIPLPVGLRIIRVIEKQ